MKENLITVTQEELEKAVYEEVWKERRILFEMHLEDYLLLPALTKQKRKGQLYISMLGTAWEEFLGQISGIFEDLAIAREIIEVMKPVYEEYRANYEETHNFDFDDYMKMTVVSYDADEFERVHNMFEEEYYKTFNEEETER